MLVGYDTVIMNALVAKFGGTGAHSTQASRLPEREHGCRGATHLCGSHLSLVHRSGFVLVGMEGQGSDSDIFALSHAKEVWNASAQVRRAALQMSPVSACPAVRV